MSIPNGEAHIYQLSDSARNAIKRQKLIDQINHLGRRRLYSFIGWILFVACVLAVYYYIENISASNFDNADSRYFFLGLVLFGVGIEIFGQLKRIEEKIDKVVELLEISN